MAAGFDRWEKDPFFSAAEEVQESADRMDSTYRTWLNSTKNSSSQCNVGDLSRDLSTALDTAKWQLEEFERAVRNSYKNGVVDEADAKDRHCQFVLAMEDKISLIQKSLQESAAASDGKPSSPRVQLDEGEHDELALFLRGPEASEDRTQIRIGVMDGIETNPVTVDDISVSDHWRSNWLPPGHRRSASANADICSWNLLIREDESASDSSNGLVEALPRRVPSFSTFTGITECVPKVKLPKNGFRKLKPADLLRSQDQSKGFHACYERKKSCLDNYEDCCDKQLHGWYGALQRLMQRSLYQVQYIHSVKLTLWASLLIFFMVLLLVRVF